MSTSWKNRGTAIHEELERGYQRAVREAWSDKRWGPNDELEDAEFDPRAWRAYQYGATTDVFTFTVTCSDATDLEASYRAALEDLRTPIVRAYAYWADRPFLEQQRAD